MLVVLLAGRWTVAITRVSSKYQIVIPKDIRRTADIHVGQEFQMIAKSGHITLVPDRPIASMRGFVRGMRTTGFREKKDRM
ncbi:MAG TPA: AbrB/MazE/SpoVT family DNA-binding domain-containing protein [Thermoanaerobaculia bacterium]|jgi:AbrB family looped-hinge helix DNA binding protein